MSFVFVAHFTGDKWSVDQSAAQYIRGLKGKILVVSAVGPVHSGKSFLLNALAGGEYAKPGRGFPVRELSILLSWTCVCLPLQHHMLE